MSDKNGVLMFSEAAARAWMLESLELARDLETGRVLARELAERCALAFGEAGALGPLDDPAHWLHALARQLAAEATPAGELVVMRMRAQGRTYWMVADREASRTYAPHVTYHHAIARFERELTRRHTRVVTYRDHRKPTAAAELLARTFGAS